MNEKKKNNLKTKAAREVKNSPVLAYILCRTRDESHFYLLSFHKSSERKMECCTLHASVTVLVVALRLPKYMPGSLCSMNALSNMIKCRGIY